MILNRRCRTVRRQTENEQVAAGVTTVGSTPCFPEPVMRLERAWRVQDYHQAEWRKQIEQQQRERDAKRVRKEWRGRGLFR